MRIKTSSFLVCVITTLFGWTLLADDSSQNSEIVVVLPDYTVHASRISPDFHEFGGVGEDAAIGAFESIEEFLNNHNGVLINAPLGHVGINETLIRGGEANFTKVLISGIATNNPADNRGGGFNFSNVSGLPISIITLNKGANSSVFGSGSMTGILSFEIGSDELDKLGQVTAEIGSFGDVLWQLTTNTVGYGNRFKMQVGAFGVEDSNRYDAHKFENTGYYLKSKYEFSPEQKLVLSAFKTDSRYERLPEDSGGQLYAEVFDLDTIDSELNVLSLQYRQLFSNQSYLDVSFGRVGNDQDSDSPGVLPGLRSPYGIPANRFEDSFERLQMQSSYQMNPNDFIRLAFGFELQRETVDSKSEVDLFPGFILPGSYEVERNLESVFAETAVRFQENHILTFAERFDRVSDQDSQWSSSLKYAYSLAGDRRDSTRVFAGYSEAFKAPSLFAINNSMVGNPDLSAETSDLWQIGIEGGNDKWKWKVSGFSQSYEDLIDLSETEQRMVNLGSVDIKGIEISSLFRLSDDLNVRVQGTKLNFDLNDEGEILRFRPEMTASVTIGKQLFSNHDLRLSYHFVGSRWDSSIPTGNVNLKADHELSFAWLAQISESVQASIRLSNILNQSNEVMVGYEKKGFGARLGVKVNF